MKYILTPLLLLTTAVGLAKSNVSFDAMGNLTTPDSKQLNLGLKSNQKGKTEKANKQFKKAAKFGNNRAKLLLANNHIKAENYPAALAWLKLIDPDLVAKHHELKQARQKLSEVLTTAEQQTSQQLLEQLQQNYSHKAAQENRQNWRDQLRFTGSRIRGHVPNHLTVLPIENGVPGINTITITGHEINSQLDQFVNQYENQMPKGQVTLAPIVLEKN